MTIALKHTYLHTARTQYRTNLILFGLFVAFTMMSYAFSAHAQVFGSVNSGFSCGAGGGGAGSILQQGQCPSSMEDGKVFSYFVCQMEKLIGETFGEFYCQLQGKFFGPMSAVITLAITLFGVAFITGIVQASGRDVMIFLFKVCVVWGFATQADLLIGVAYKFFMGGLKTGIEIVVSSVFTPDSSVNITGKGGERIYSYMDEIFKKLVNMSTESIQDGGSGSGSGSGSASNSNDNTCKNAIFAILTLLAIAFPPLFALGVFLFIKLAAFFLRAVFGYIYAIIGISFLIVLAPIFLSFYFWRQTQEYYEKWLGHLASFAVQMVIIFAFISFLLSMNVKSITKDLLDLVVPYNKSVETQGIRWPWKVCTLCEFEVTDSSTGGGSTGGGGGREAPAGSVKCKENPGKPMPPTSLSGPGNNASGGMNGTLLKLASKVLITLVVLTYIVSSLLELVPQLASRIASAGIGGSRVQAGALVGKNMPLPAEQALETFEKNFMDRLGKGGNPVTAYSEAFTQASSAMVTGASRASGGQVTGTGMSQMFQNFLWNGA